MKVDASNFLWHRSIGILIDRLNSPYFWRTLVRTLSEHVKIDNWVVLKFENNKVSVVNFVEWESDAEKQALLSDYLNGLYLLDPFYISYLENPRSGLFHLSDVAPENFEHTDYYKLYFEKYIFNDEVNYFTRITNDETVVLSLGSKEKINQYQISMLELVSPWVTSLIRQRMLTEIDKVKIFAPMRSWKETTKTFNKGLTPRETEVMSLILMGFSTREISAKILVNIDTVKSHRKNLYSKLNIKSQAELFSLYLENSRN